jgi:hypothetical protein
MVKMCLTPLSLLSLARSRETPDPLCSAPGTVHTPRRAAAWADSLDEAKAAFRAAGEARAESSRRPRGQSGLKATALKKVQSTGAWVLRK